MAGFKPVHGHETPAGRFGPTATGTGHLQACAELTWWITSWISRRWKPATATTSKGPAPTIRRCCSNHPLAYSRGLIGSRRIEAACRENIVFMALSGDSQPTSTLAAFVCRNSGMGRSTLRASADPLRSAGADRAKMFAIDGVKLPGNASKDGAAPGRTSAPGREDGSGREDAGSPPGGDAVAADSGPSDREGRGNWPARYRPTPGSTGNGSAPPGSHRRQERCGSQPNRQQSAKMATGKASSGLYRGGCRRWRAQVIVEAQAHGTGSEQEIAVAGGEGNRITANPGDPHHCRCRLSQRGQPESLGRGRDPCPHRRSRHAGMGRTLQRPGSPQGKARSPPPQGGEPKQEAGVSGRPIRRTTRAGTCRCPASKALYQNGSNCTHNGAWPPSSGCPAGRVPCGLRNQCLRTPGRPRYGKCSSSGAKAPETPKATPTG